MNEALIARLREQAELIPPQCHGWGCANDGDVQTADCAICGRLLPRGQDIYSQAADALAQADTREQQLEKETSMAKKIAKKRNPQDSTLRNVRAINKRVKELEARIERLKARIERLEQKEANRPLIEEEPLP